jgi:hypothetical protein
VQVAQLHQCYDLKLSRSICACGFAAAQCGKALPYR